jgi:hypothetical protein
MIIRLVPPTSEPTVVFSIDFQNLPSNLQLPQAWLTQITYLNMDDLEVPQSLHALDKSTALVSLLHEVTFDLVALTISCIFIDGAKEEWPIMGTACLSTLESVLCDVDQSTALADREKAREMELRKLKEIEIAKPPTPPSTVKSVKHKKRRSLLMTLVSCVSPPIFPVKYIAYLFF